MYRTEEVYPNAPLQFVACEVRFPTIRKAFSEQGLDAFQSAFSKTFPIFEPIDEKEFSFGPEGAQGQSRRWIRFLSTSRTASVSIQPKRLVVETTHYEHYALFRNLVQTALHALEDAEHIPVFERVGLRYIDEIRVDEVSEVPGDWSPYILASLLDVARLCPTGAHDLRIEGVLRFGFAGSQQVILRYGTLDGEVVGDGPLRVKPNKVRSGPLFLIDIDSFTHAQPHEEEFQTEKILTICDALRDPVRSVFEACITDKLRDEILRRAQ
jgi:uncharacterized protein (TIGR04255 family)